MNYLKLQAEAQAAGLIRYNGKPCKKCSSTERYARNGNCAPCTVATAKKWRCVNADSKKIKATAANWREDNRDYLRVYLKAWRLKKQERAA